MRTISTIKTELIFSHLPGRASASAIVPTESFGDLNAEKNRVGCSTMWRYEKDPHTQSRQPAFTPIQGGLLKMIEDQGIRHGGRFLATIEFKEAKQQTQMWMVNAQPLPLTLVP